MDSPCPTPRSDHQIRGVSNYGCAIKVGYRCNPSIAKNIWDNDMNARKKYLRITLLLTGGSVFNASTAAPAENYRNQASGRYMSVEFDHGWGVYYLHTETEANYFVVHKFKDGTVRL